MFRTKSIPGEKRLLLFALPLLLQIYAENSLSANELDQEVIKALASRESELDRYIMEYDWSECRAPLSTDPFERANWDFDKMAHTLHYEAWVIRPYYRLHFSGPFSNQKSVDRSWVNDEFIGRGLTDAGTVSYTRDVDRYKTTGPFPVITPLEMWQTFDIREGLLEMLKAGRITASRRPDGRIALRGDRINVSSDDDGWVLLAVLDPDRFYVPTSIKADIDRPRGHISWEMRTLSTISIGNVEAIGEAILALSNTCTNKEKWQIYHFKVLSVQRDMAMNTADLRPELPTANAKILDEIDLYHRVLDGDGRAIVEKKWTPEERRAEKEGLRVTVAKIYESRAETKLRRSRLWIITGSAGLVTLALAGAWIWRRRNPATALR